MTASEGPPTLCKWGCAAQQPGVHPWEQLPASGLQPLTTQRRLTPCGACGDGRADSARHSLPAEAAWLGVSRPHLTAFPWPLCSEPLRLGPRPGPSLAPCYSPHLQPILHLVPRAQQRPALRSQSQRGDKITPVRQNLSVVSPHRPEPSVCRRVCDSTQEDFTGAGHPVGTAATQAGGGVSTAAPGTEASRGHRASERGGTPARDRTPASPPKASPRNLLATSRLCVCTVGQLSTPGKTIRAKHRGPHV